MKAILLLAITTLLFAPGVGAADRVVNATEIIVLSDDIYKRTTNVTHAGDGDDTSGGDESGGDGSSGGESGGDRPRGGGSGGNGSGGDGNRSGLGDGTNPGRGSGRGNSPNRGTHNPNRAGSGGGRR